MKTNPYQVLGPSIAPMLGRAALVQRLDSHLLKPSPDHVSVVGPAHFGKSVLLQHLAGTHRTESSRYATATYVDLRHRVPASDGEFMQRFAEEIRTALQAVRRELSEWIESEDENIHEVLGLVLDELEKTDEHLLVVLDGFDYALAGTGLTRNLWDQLRALAQKNSLRLVTGSRRPLRELCKTEDSRTSDFWEIFYDTPVRVAALDDADMEAFLQPLRDEGCEFDESARKEITNWTGRVPILLCALLHALWEEHRGALVSKSSIDGVAETVMGEHQQLLAALWDDCDDELQADLGELSKRDIPLTDLSDKRRDALEERGFGRVSRKRLCSCCCLMQRYAGAQAPAVANLKRLFGEVTDFEKNIRSLLELRLEQVARRGLDEELCRCVGNAVHDITPYPVDALTWVGDIKDRALKLIWDAELPYDRKLPDEWMEEWKHAGIVRLPEDRGKLDEKEGQQILALRLITGSMENTRRSAKRVTKGTYVLVNYLHSVRNFRFHRRGNLDEQVSIGFAASVVFAAISLVECLTEDLAGAHTV